MNRYDLALDREAIIVEQKEVLFFWKKKRKFFTILTKEDIERLGESFNPEMLDGYYIDPKSFIVSEIEESHEQV